MSAKPPESGEPSPEALRSLKRRRTIDRLVRVIVTTGGLAIIIFILGILAFIVSEVAPLAAGAEVERQEGVPRGEDPAAAVIVDEYERQWVRAERAGWVAFEGRDAAGEPLPEARLDLFSGEALEEGDEPERSFTRLERRVGTDVLLGVSSENEIVIAPVQFGTPGQPGAEAEELAEGLLDEEELVFQGLGSLERLRPVVIELDGEGPLDALSTTRLRYPGYGTESLAADTTAVVVSQRGTGPLRLDRIEIEAGGFGGGGYSADYDTTELAVSRAHRLLLPTEDERWLYGVSGDNTLLLYELPTPGAEAQDRFEPVEVHAGGARITALALLAGDMSLLVGRADGSIEVWLRVRDTPNTRRDLARVRSFQLGEEPIAQLAVGRRSRGFMAFDEGGRAGLFNSTSERTLWTGDTGVGAPLAAFMTPRESGGLVVGEEGSVFWALDNPHPEAGWKAFFGEVWYEDYDEERYLWKSGGGAASEKKLSMVPLILGTLKGTFYSLLLAVPLAVLAALYTSQFLHPSVKSKVKPIIEIMAALPSVILGFIGGLWLAPRLEKVLPGLFAIVLILPLVMLATGWLWSAVPAAIRVKLPRWSETLLHMLTLVLGIYVAVLLAGPIDESVFGGNYKEWLNEVAGLRFDQRNAIVIAIAMGFAVIPIIYTISEDAFSNVPRSLTLGSRALGASPWRTASRVVLPTASPGIFSATMVGFGRAVGETMIVLMATGNTPLMEWNPFNGFRTLAANIATEIPEAPIGGTLYRTLFLAALMLFVLTFIVNTAAELVRERLRRKYGQL